MSNKKYSANLNAIPRLGNSIAKLKITHQALKWVN